MPIGTPGLIGAHGGMGKTQLIIDLLLAVAADAPFMGLDTIGTVCALLSDEDDARDLHYRIAAQCKRRGMSMAEVGNRLFVYPATEHSGEPLLIATRDGVVEPTHRYMSLRAELIRRGVKFLALDNVAALCAFNLNDPSLATQAIALLGQLVPAEGNVVLIAHVDKLTAKAGYSTQGYSGTAAWHNRCRWRWFLFAPGRADDAEEGEEEPGDDGRRILEVQKINAGTWGQRYALRFGPDGSIGLDGAEDTIVSTVRRGIERRWVLQQIAKADATGDPIHASEKANRNLHKRLSVLEGFPRAFRGRKGTRVLFALAERAKADGLLAEGLVKKAGRYAAPVWRLTDAGRAEATA